MRKQTGLLVLFVLLVGSACAKKAPPPAPAPEPVRQVTPPVTDDGAAERARLEAEARRRAEEAARNRATLEESIFFAYDRFDIQTSAQATLQSKVAILRADPAIRLRIEGHADERGSLEYNEVLAMRRATAARDFLAGFGIDVSRLAVLSFGEDRPADPGHTEAAWARNRRAEFVVTAGLSATTR